MRQKNGFEDLEKCSTPITFKGKLIQRFLSVCRCYQTIIVEKYNYFDII